MSGFGCEEYILLIGGFRTLVVAADPVCLGI